MDRKSSHSSDLPGNNRVHLTVCPTTGGKFQLSVSPTETISGLKYTLAQRLRLRADRMSLLHKEKVLCGGSLLDNQVFDGSHLTLLPNMETGTANIAADSRVMQALENLSESQVNDFLTGRAPLLLAMKLGEHMMFVQLQLSTTSCNARRRSFHGPTSPPYRPVSSGAGSPPPSPPPATRPTCCGAGLPTGSSGAVIDSVNHLGQGVYSGTFSGTLDPTIHDVTGKPKRDVNTILHILNDLLVASPQLRQSDPRPSDHYPSSPPPSSPTGQSFFHSPTEQPLVDDRLRGKVESLQKMMQERRLRRQQKRGMRAPYHWTDRRSMSSQQQRHRSLANFGSAAISCGDREGPTDGHPQADATFTNTPSNMEHESVLV